jgi:hypothetical protein
MSRIDAHPGARIRSNDGIGELTVTEQEKPPIDMNLVRRNAEMRAATFQAIGRFSSSFHSSNFPFGLPWRHILAYPTMAASMP